MAFRFPSSVFPVLLGAALALPGAASAEAFDPVPPADTVAIASGGLQPARLALSGAPRLVFVNDSASLVRVELDLARGEGIACGGGGEPPTRGRKFVVSNGGLLECEAPAASVAYRVFRNGGGETEELRGSIEP